MVHPKDGRRHRPGREPTLGEPPGSFTESRPQIWIGDERSERCGERRNLAGRHQSRAAVRNFVMNRHLVGDHHGQPARHRLDHREAEVLRIRGQHENIGIREGTELFGAAEETGPIDIPVDAEPGGLRS